MLSGGNQTEGILSKDSDPVPTLQITFKHSSVGFIHVIIYLLIATDFVKNKLSFMK